MTNTKIKRIMLNSISKCINSSASEEIIEIEISARKLPESRTPGCLIKTVVPGSYFPGTYFEEFWETLR